MTGATCVGDWRLAALDVGYDPRAAGERVREPDWAYESVGYDQHGETWLVEGSRVEMLATIRAAGYRVIERAG